MAKTLKLDIPGPANRYPLVRLDDLIERSHRTARPTPGTAYDLVTVRLGGGGVVKRTSKDGAEIYPHDKKYAVAGRLIISKLDLKDGAAGIVPRHLHGAVVSGDFPQFEIDTRSVLPEYLLAVLLSKSGRAWARKCSRGTTNRKRVFLPAWLEANVQLPPITVQRKLLKQLPTR